MTTISPTRVSMYDFLYQDTQPMVSLLADAAQLSLPQTSLALSASLQAIVSALLAYQQRHQGQTVNKKLFNRGAVKELRQHNSMNFATINATLYHRHDVADAIFGDNARVVKASEYIATQVDATTAQVQTLLTCLCVIVLRELAILADYSKLDNEELDKWFALQPQFLSAQRFEEKAPTTTPALIENTNDTNEASQDSANNKNAAHADDINKQQNQHQAVASENDHLENDHLENITDIASEVAALTLTPPSFDTYWFELTGFEPKHDLAVQDMQQATSNYLKAIGRSSDNLQQGRHNDMLVFAQMHAIALPHQRWLLQLAKISDIYLSRNRLRITSEPATPPTPPFVSLGLLGGNSDNTPVTTSETPIEYDAPKPLWRNPVILLIILVIGGLGALATLKYQMQKSDNASQAEPIVKQVSAEERQQQDVAIVKVDEDDSLESTAAE